MNPEMQEALDHPVGPGGFSFVIQGAILLVWLVLTIFAIRAAAKTTSGAATPLWILLTFLVPFVGAITTIACLKGGAERHASRRTAKTLRE